MCYANSGFEGVLEVVGKRVRELLKAFSGSAPLKPFENIRIW